MAFVEQHIDGIVAVRFDCRQSGAEYDCLERPFEHEDEQRVLRKRNQWELQNGMLVPGHIYDLWLLVEVPDIESTS